MSFKSGKYDTEPCYVSPKGEKIPYVPRDILSHRDAYSAVLHMSLKHMADFQILMMEIICEKYDLNADEVMKTIQEDIRMQDMDTHPIIHSMGYFTKEELEAKLPPKAEAKAVEAPEAAEAAEAVAAVAVAVASVEPKRKIIRKKKE
jgi:hypothetical protein